MIAAVAMGAGATSLLLGVTEPADASTPPQVTAKNDAAEIRPTGPACSQQVWPYYETECLRYVRHPGARNVRIIPIVGQPDGR